MILVRMNTQNQ